MANVHFNMIVEMNQLLKENNILPPDALALEKRNGC